VRFPVLTFAALLHTRSCWMAPRAAAVRGSYLIRLRTGRDPGPSADRSGSRLPVRRGSTRLRLPRGLERDGSRSRCLLTHRWRGFLTSGGGVRFAIDARASGAAHRRQDLDGRLPGAASCAGGTRSRSTTAGSGSAPGALWQRRQSMKTVPAIHWRSICGALGRGAPAARRGTLLAAGCWRCYSSPWALTRSRRRRAGGAAVLGTAMDRPGAILALAALLRFHDYALVPSATDDRRVHTPGRVHLLPRVPGRWTPPQLYRRIHTVDFTSSQALPPGAAVLRSSALFSIPVDSPARSGCEPYSMLVGDAGGAILLSLAPPAAAPPGAHVRPSEGPRSSGAGVSCAAHRRVAPLVKAKPDDAAAHGRILAVEARAHGADARRGARGSSRLSIWTKATGWPSSARRVLLLARGRNRAALSRVDHGGVLRPLPGVRLATTSHLSST